MVTLVVCYASIITLIENAQNQTQSLSTQTFTADFNYQVQNYERCSA